MTIEQFQSTLPVRGATRTTMWISVPTTFQSTLPVRGATGQLEQRHVNGLISIHAPREGSDDNGYPQVAVALQFQSTLPVRGATAGIIRICLPCCYFNPRSP